MVFCEPYWRPYATFISVFIADSSLIAHSSGRFRHQECYHAIVLRDLRLMVVEKAVIYLMNVCEVVYKH